MLLGVATLMWMFEQGAALAARGVAVDAEAVDYHVRALDPLVRSWIEKGAADSRTLRSLLAELAASDVIVYVELVDRIASGARGQMYFVARTPTARYLRVEIILSGGRADMIALIAHELRHAAEVSASPLVSDSVSLSTFYLGMLENKLDAGHYDSAAARATQDIVRNEILAHRGNPADDLQLAQLKRSRAAR